MCLKCPTKAPPEAMVLVQVSASTLSQSASVGSHFTGNQIKLRCRAHTRSPQILEQSQRSSCSHLYPHIPCPGPRSEVRWSLGLLTGHGTTAPMMSSFFSTSDNFDLFSPNPWFIKNPLIYCMRIARGTNDRETVLCWSRVRQWSNHESSVVGIFMQI